MPSIIFATQCKHCLTRSLAHKHALKTDIINIDHYLLITNTKSTSILNQCPIGRFVWIEYISNRIIGKYKANQSIVRLRHISIVSFLIKNIVCFRRPKKKFPIICHFIAGVLWQDRFVHLVASITNWHKSILFLHLIGR